MAYDEAIVARVRAAMAEIELGPAEERGEMKMFGGICFTLNGKMVVGVRTPWLLVRMSDEEMEVAMAEGLAEPMSSGGRTMPNFAYAPDTTSDDVEVLANWVEGSVTYVREHMLVKPKKGRK